MSWALRSVITFLQLGGILLVKNNTWPAITTADYEHSGIQLPQ